MARFRERLRGGEARGMKPSDFDAKELARGTLHETEHTDDVMVAMEIAMDHLAEDPAYYKKLERLETRPRRRAKKKKKKRQSSGRQRYAKVSDKQLVRQLVRDQMREAYDG